MQGNWGRLLNAEMAGGTKFLLKRARFYLRVLYLRPDSSSVKCVLRGLSDSLVIVCARRVIALRLRSVRLVEGWLMILNVVCVIFVSLFLLVVDNML